MQALFTWHTKELTSRFYGIVESKEGVESSPLPIRRVREQLAGTPAASFLGTSRRMSVGDVLPREPNQLRVPIDMASDQSSVRRTSTLTPEDLPQATKRMEATLLRLCERQKVRIMYLAIFNFERGLQNDAAPKKLEALFSWLSN